METPSRDDAYRTGYRVYRITTKQKRLLYALVVDDTIVAADQVPWVGANWTTVLRRMEQSGATYEIVREDRGDGRER